MRERTQESRIRTPEPEALGASTTEEAEAAAAHEGLSSEDWDILDKTMAAYEADDKAEDAYDAEEDAAREAAGGERTHAEWRKLLKKTVGRAEDIEIPSKPEGMSGLSKKKEVYARRRIDELGWAGKLDQFAAVEERFRAIGEAYDRLGWKSKLAAGGILVGGAAAGSAFALPTTFGICVGGLVAQRAMGLSSMFQQIEKQLQEAKEAQEGGKKAEGLLSKRKWFQKLSSHLEGENQKRAAMLAAIGWTAGMGYTINKVVEHGANAFEWLKEQYYHGGTPSSHAVFDPHARAPAAEAGTQAPQPAAAAAAGVHGSEASAAKVEMPSVGASSHGYEGMLKNLSKELHKHNLTLPPNADSKSDLYKLFHAKPGELDKVVHQIALKHHAFQGGTSVSIDPSAHMTIDAHGQVHLGGAAHHDATDVSSWAHKAPAHHHQSPAAHHAAEAPKEAHRVTVLPPPEHHATVSHLPPLESHVAQQPAAELPHAAHAQSPEAPRDGDWGAFGVGRHYSVMPSEPAAHTAPATHHAAAPASHAASVETHTSVPVNLKEPHVYLDSKGHFYALGGKGAQIDKLAQDYALKHRVPVTVDASYKFLGRIFTPRAVEYVPNAKGTLDQVFLKGPMAVPDLKSIIKRVF